MDIEESGSGFSKLVICCTLFSSFFSFLVFLFIFVLAKSLSLAILYIQFSVILHYQTILKGKVDLRAFAPLQPSHLTFFF